MFAEFCLKEESVAELVAKAFLVLVWDPSKEVNDKEFYQL